MAVGKEEEEEEVYVARVHWLPDGYLGVQVCVYIRMYV